MKKLLFSLLTLTLTTGLFAQKKAADVAKFKTETIDLGKLQQGNPTTATFSVINVGTEPLIIEQANPTCGCTISKYTKEPIANGKAGEILATYNAANVGAFEKHLTVKFAGVDEVKSITIKGEVLNKEDYSKLPADQQVKSSASTEIKAGTIEPLKPVAVEATTEKTVAPAKTKTVVKSDGKKTKSKSKTETANKKKK